MIIGIPKEIMHGEGRVSATPETVKKLVADGATVLFEKGAGVESYFPDALYAEAGATLVDDVAEVFAKSDVILKVKEPLFNEAKGLHEVDMMHEGQYLITFIHPASPVNHEMVKKMAAKKVIALTLDGVPRISRAQSMDALTSMSTCAGYKGMIMATDALPKFVPQIFCAVGMIKPANVLVLGTGVAGILAEAIKDMDIVFLSALIPGKIAPILITEEMVKTMKPGSVIVDIAIDQGGDCEITPPGSIEVKHGVTLQGIKNIPGMLPTSSTWMFANNIYNLVKYLTKDGKIVLDTSDEIVSSILVCRDGEIVHAGAKEAMGL